MDRTMFRDWLLDQMRERGWSKADLARASGLDTGYISNVFNRKRNVGAQACLQFAKAFHLPDSVVLQAAGLMAGRPLPSEADATINEINEIYARLPRGDQEELLEFSRMKLRRQERGESGTVAAEP